MKEGVNMSMDKNNYFKELGKRFSHDYLDLLSLARKSYSVFELQKILKAYHIANEAHFNQKRLSGEPFITHPINVAYILAETGFDSDTVCAALLHDVVEDTNYSKEDINQIFGNVISNLVDGVTKMKGSDFTSKRESVIATHKKILDSITKDARIIAIKLADRLHNMFTLDYLREEKQKEIANETLDFYVNLARILGIYQIKDELEDLSLFMLDKDKFLSIYELRQELYEGYEKDFSYVDREARNNLKDIGVNLTSKYKIKNIGGIYSELSNGTKLDEIKDLVAIRMMVENVEDCYKTLGVVHGICKSVPNSFKDLIANPKYNGYQSLITNVVTPDESEFQIRIRTNDMQRTNELGMVSNWSLQTQEHLNSECSKMFDANKKELKMKGKK